MKIKIALLAISTILAASCTSIEDYPDGRLDKEKIFGNQKLTGSYLNSCYDGLYRSVGHIYGNNSFISAATDDAHDVDDASNGAIAKWNAGAVSAYGNPLATPSIWDNYTYIRRCNILLEQLPTANIHSESTRMQYQAEAYTLRALYYLQLFKAYGAVPVILDNTDENNYDYSTLTKLTPAQVARQIISDCRKAIEIDDLGWHPGSSDMDNYRMSRAIAAAVMSEAALFAASPLNADGSFSWEEAAQVTGEALNLCLDNGYELYTTQPSNDELSMAYTPYDLYFLSPYDVKGSVDRETIQGYRGNYSIWHYHGLPTILGQSTAGSCPSQELVDCYETIHGKMPILGYADDDHLQPIINPEATLYDESNPYANRDPRLKATIYYNGSLARPLDEESEISTTEGGNCAISATNVRNTRTGYYLRKYANPLSDRSTQADGPLRSMRLAELYLNHAEALLEACTAEQAPAQAIAMVNKIRARVGMPALSNSMSCTEFRTRLRNERRIELTFEDNRFYDVRRWCILDQTGRVVTGMKANADGTYSRFVVSRRAAYADKFLRFPISSDEVVRLKASTGIDFQNQGW